MFSRLFGRKKDEEVKEEIPAPENANWAFLCADMHSHFIPGIDDGAKDMEDSLKMIAGMKEMGYNTLVTTPHIMVDFYPNTTRTIQEGLKTVQDALKERNIDITLRAAAEYYIDEHFIKLLDTEPLLTVHNNEVLVEFSMLYEPPMLIDVLFKMQGSGYTPIIAHPERYLFFHKDHSKYRLMRDRGCKFQLNMLAISGHYGRAIKAVAEELMRKGMYDYCGSDMHHEKHAALLKALAHSKEHHMFTTYPFQNRRLCSPTV